MSTCWFVAHTHGRGQATGGRIIPGKQISRTAASAPRVILGGDPPRGVRTPGREMWLHSPSHPGLLDMAARRA
jgi:hypothetical protein